MLIVGIAPPFVGFYRHQAARDTRTFGCEAPVPSNVHIDLEITVSDAVAHPAHLLPGQLGGLISERPVSYQRSHRYRIPEHLVSEFCRQITWRQYIHCYAKRFFKLDLN